MLCRMKLWVKRIGIFLASLLAMLLVAEIVIRILGLAPGYGAVPFGECQTCSDPELLWVLTPGAPGINSRGMRGPELEVPKRRPRVLCLGDSIVDGNYLEPGQTIPRRLEGRLAELDIDCEVLNGGVTGYNTIQEARWLEVNGEALAPDLVLLFVCINDLEALNLLPEGIFRYADRHGADAALEMVHKTFRHSPFQRALLEHSHVARLLFVIVTRFRRPEVRGSGRTRLDMQTRDAGVLQQGFARIARFCHDRKLPAEVILLPLFKNISKDSLPRWFEEEVARLADENDLPLVDIRDPILDQLRGEPEAKINSRQDDIHPNARGVDLMARILARRLGQYHEHLRGKMMRGSGDGEK
jgi:lysophospholipase L1-like esterase